MKLSKRQLIIAVILVIGGIVIFQQYQRHQEELKRNREYEVSLVNALKNTYEGIEEIRITDSNYTMPPGSWSCDVKILFNDGKEILYGINHRLTNSENYDGLMKGNTSSEINEQWEFLRNRTGKTRSTITVVYSDNTMGEQ
ncbi:hypothetical protein ACTGZQ_00775 [Streptococcus suis]